MKIKPNYNLISTYIMNVNDFRIFIICKNNLGYLQVDDQLLTKEELVQVC